jgi:hypothetical protein
MQEVLEIPREVEKATAEKTRHKQHRNGLINVEIEESEESLIENVSNESDSDYITVRRRGSN